MLGEVVVLLVLRLQLVGQSSTLRKTLGCQCVQERSKYIESTVDTCEKERAEARSSLDTNNKQTNIGLSVIIKRL